MKIQDWIWIAIYDSLLISAIDVSVDMMWSLDRDPTGFCTSEPDPDGLDFEKNSTGSDIDIQTALITAVKWLIRGNRSGSNISIGLPD